MAKINLDYEFLDQLGLSEMPIKQKDEFLAHVNSKLALRVGEELTQGMSDDQLDEFGHFVDKDILAMQNWLDTNIPDYRNATDFIVIKESLGNVADDVDLLSSYGSVKCLAVNRPDYPQIVETTLETLKQEIIDNKDKILG
jgi:hypothetical protein